MTAAALIHGSFDPAFRAVRDAFRENFASRGEIGAAVAIYADGRKVLDLWAGVADPETQAPWERDSIVCMMSVGKAMAALCVYRLIERDEIDLDLPVARYWPEFARAGKAAITVRQLLAGQAGLIYTDHAPDGAGLDWATMTDALSRQEPEWQPGTRGAYHSATAGFLFGELVRRVDGRSLDRFFAEEIAEPLNISYKFGLDDTDMARVARILPNPQSVTLTQIADPTSKLGRAWRIMPDRKDFLNAEDFRRGLFPSANGHGNARAVARIYGALSNGGEIDGYHLVSPAMIEIMRDLAWDDICGMTDRPFRYGHGFFLSNDLAPFGGNPRAFGHPGAGCAIGFADPEAGIAFSYSPNFMCAGAGVGDRCEALIDALQDC